MLAAVQLFDRPPFGPSGFVLLALVAATLASVPRPRRAAPPLVCPGSMIDLAERQARDHRFDDAATTLRVALSAELYDGEAAERLALLAWVYDTLGRTNDVGGDRTWAAHVTE